MFGLNQAWREVKFRAAVNLADEDANKVILKYAAIDTRTLHINVQNRLKDILAKALAESLTDTGQLLTAPEAAVVQLASLQILYDKNIMKENSTICGKGLRRIWEHHSGELRDIYIRIAVP